jgi:phage tail-like protein
MILAGRDDPYISFKFQVEIQGLIVGGFSEVSGLQVETKTHNFREGGVNDHLHKLPQGSEQSNLTLKRGITDSDVLWKWHRDVVDGIVIRKSGRIILMDFEGNEKWHWTFEGAYPVKWVGPDFKANSNATAVETLELVHKGIKKG